MQTESGHYAPINSYGLIGDLHTVALVGLDGSIDWSCLPIFDSPSVFGAILDAAKGGRFAVRLPDSSEGSATYMVDTNILITTMRRAAAAIDVIDYMPIQTEDGGRLEPDSAYICRHLECTKGVNVVVEIEFDPRPEYGKQVRIDRGPNGATVVDCPLSLHSSHPIAWDAKTGLGRITLSHGDSARIVLCFGAHKPASDIVRWSDSQLYDTRQFWERWIRQCLYKGRWRRMVERSALTLKLLAFKPTGAILAAPTTSLPEGIGGERNWDYRFSWLRDSALILNALLPLGFAEEADAYVRWIISQRPPADAPMPILYSITDVDTTDERVLPQFEGYMGSAPVRIGNAARDQVQLDVYGEVIDALYIYGIFGHPPNQEVWDYVLDLAARICSDWQGKDEGIWEVRGEPQHFTYSKLMCWVGLDRALLMARDFGFDAPVELWEQQRDEIHAFIMAECVDAKGNFLTQSPAGPDVDASNLLAPILGLLPAEHPVMMNTVDETMRQLMVSHMVFRYLTDDGLSGHEGTFNICTFWLVEALALQNRLDEAENIFNRMLDRASHLGLYAEETEAEANLALGNFPQAFSHLGLINAALALNSRLPSGA